MKTWDELNNMTVEELEKEEDANWKYRKDILCVLEYKRRKK